MITAATPETDILTDLLAGFRNSGLAAAREGPPHASMVGSLSNGVPSAARTAAPGRGVRLLPIRAVMATLDRDEGDVLRSVEDGRLLWAFNVALEPGRARKKTLRLLPQCVEHYQTGQECALEWADVERLLLPGARPTLPAPQIERLLNVCQAHVAALLAAKELLLAASGRHGRGGASTVWRYSVRDFLRRRRFPVPEAEG